LDIPSSETRQRWYRQRRTRQWKIQRK
jgi:hypothetical protein